MVQSIIGATEKRRESGAGVAVVTDMGDLESVRLGGGGVYQEWGLWGLGESGYAKVHVQPEPTLSPPQNFMLPGTDEA